jgi:hypothetical protein
MRNEQEKWLSDTGILKWTGEAPPVTEELELGDVRRETKKTQF